MNPSSYGGSQTIASMHASGRHERANRQSACWTCQRSVPSTTAAMEVMRAANAARGVAGSQGRRGVAGTRVGSRSNGPIQNHVSLSAGKDSRTTTQSYPATASASCTSGRMGIHSSTPPRRSRQGAACRGDESGSPPALARRRGSVRETRPLRREPSTVPGRRNRGCSGTPPRRRDPERMKPRRARSRPSLPARA